MPSRRSNAISAAFGGGARKFSSATVSSDFVRFDALISLALAPFLLYYEGMDIKEALKTPHDTDELKKLYKDNGLVYYTPKEELFNTLSHGLGAVAAVVFMVFMLLKASSAAAIATAVLSCSMIAIEFSVSAIYHGVKDMRKKLLWRTLDFPSVNLNVIACATATCLLYENVYGYVALGTSFAIAIAIFALCLYRFDIFRKVSVASTFVIGGLMFAAFFTAYFSPKGISTATSIVYLAGLVSCLLGAAVFGVHKRYVHCLFHVFVLVGPILFLVATYMQIIA